MASSGGSSKLTSCTASCFLNESRRSDRCSRRMTTSSESGPRLRRPSSPSSRSPVYPACQPTGLGAALGTGQVQAGALAGARVSGVGALARAGRPAGRAGCCWWTCGGRFWGGVAQAWWPGHAGSWVGCGQRQPEMQGCWSLGMRWVETLCLWVTGGSGPPASMWGPKTDCQKPTLFPVATHQAWFFLCLHRLFLCLRSGGLLLIHQSPSSSSPTSHLNDPLNHSAKGTCPPSIYPSHEPSTHWFWKLPSKGPASACVHSPPLGLSP